MYNNFKMLDAKDLRRQQTHNTEKEKLLKGSHNAAKQHLRDSPDIGALQERQGVFEPYTLSLLFFAS